MCRSMSIFMQATEEDYKLIYIYLLFQKNFNEYLDFRILMINRNKFDSDICN